MHDRWWEGVRTAQEASTILTGLLKRLLRGVHGISGTTDSVTEFAAIVRAIHMTKRPHSAVEAVLFALPRRVLAEKGALEPFPSENPVEHR